MPVNQTAIEALKERAPLDMDVILADDEQGPITVMRLTAWQVDLLGMLADAAHQFGIELDKKVFDNNNADGCMTMGTLVAEKFSGFFNELSEVLDEYEYVNPVSL